ncbi:mfs multidrug transporter [Venturia nashicola]|uniref:Mfs multidrug transporter n=1 Tax=Venturia nashicola TaxID=86259 RepID=A0A4Z1PDP1_9PEZI|nr:mfs multidrug transporter [Venturia nashicola]TLD29937.1 mfs multidrug transporter [Venturia nashicola]
MTSLFCCSAPQPYRPQTLSHEAKFRTFMKWASFPTESTVQCEKKPADLSNPFVIQLVRQINFGAIERKRYFLIDEANDTFLEITEADLIEANYEKLNAWVLSQC